MWIPFGPSVQQERCQRRQAVACPRVLHSYAADIRRVFEKEWKFGEQSGEFRACSIFSPRMIALTRNPGKMV